MSRRCTEASRNVVGFIVNKLQTYNMYFKADKLYFTKRLRHDGISNN